MAKNSAAVVAVLLGVLGCHAPQRHASTAIRHDPIYARADVRFSRAWFYKPDEAASEGFPIELAPLLVQGILTEQSAPAEQARFGAVTDSDTGISVDTSKPAIYRYSGTAILQGRSYEQHVFAWAYPSENGGSARFQGLRMTLDTSGFPIIWETRWDASGAFTVYVSRSLEESASDVYGPPLPGRGFSIEPSLEEHPTVVVARVIDDAPFAMGPFVYLDADNRSVSTVICRCMPSQVDAFTETRYYDLVPAEEAPAFEELFGWSMDDAIAIERRLRLPELE